MASAAVNSRLRYLDTAATRFAVAAPTVAAGLRTQSVRVAYDANLPLTAPTQSVCGACGGVLVPGVSCIKVIVSDPRKPTQSGRKVKSSIVKATSSAKPTKVMVYTCKRCHQNTRIPIGQPAKRKQIAVSRVEEKREINAAVSAPSGSAVQAREDIEKPALANDAAVMASQPQTLTKSKQRAKTKKQSGLQALLAKNRANASAAASPAFDLMDFMKTS